MTDMSQTETLGQASSPGESVDQLALRALTLVAARQRRNALALDRKFAIALEDAVASGASGDGLAMALHMVDAGISPEDIADNYIPAVARRLGDRWCEDDIGFATVTIGAARLQGMLRDLENLSGRPRTAEPEGLSLLIVVATGIFHTLGAMVLAQQMRRAGHAVRLMLGAEPDALAAAVRQARFDAVLVSSAEGAPAAGVRRLVMAVKGATGEPPPVVIGGTLLETAHQSGADVLTLTGADYATSDPNEALRLCGLTTAPHDANDRGTGD